MDRDRPKLELVKPEFDVKVLGDKLGGLRKRLHPGQVVPNRRVERTPILHIEELRQRRLE